MKQMVLPTINANIFLSKICHFAQLTNAFVIHVSETKFDGYVLNNDIVIEGCNLIRLDCSRKVSGVTWS